MKAKRLTFTVTNDLTYDQRMQRICRSLASAGYDVTLVGRKMGSSVTLRKEPFRQVRLSCSAESGKLMYLLFNFRLLVYLLFHTPDLVCAIDLDTILPCYFISKYKKCKRVYDAHELFTEQKEIVTRPLIHKAWLTVERFAVPRFTSGYTVNEFIKKEFTNRYKVNYEIIRNMPVLYPLTSTNIEEPFVLYQGAVNEGRSFETLIPAMRHVNCRLVICGTGNFVSKAKKLVAEHNLENKIEMIGALPPDDLKKLTPKAYIAVTLFEKTGLNQYHSLANRFFDFIMAGVPQVCVGYPEYEAINNQYDIAVLIPDTSEQAISVAINLLLNDPNRYNQLKQNCLVARKHLNWSTEEKKLVSFYRTQL